jgi:ribosome-dependent ATPase
MPFGPLTLPPDCPMSPVEPAAVEASGVSHRYGMAAALSEVSLSIPAGTTTAFVGPDGVGKSTLLALIAGVRRLQSGTLRTLGGDVTRRAQRDRNAARIAYMPQGLGRNLYPSLSVFENIDFFGRLFGQSSADRNARIDRLLWATDLQPFSDRPAGKLSGGMKQKLALCCSLIHDPELLILDEPTTGVDPLSRRRFWAFIDEMKREQPDMRKPSASIASPSSTQAVCLRRGPPMTSSHKPAVPTLKKPIYRCMGTIKKTRPAAS